MRNDSKRIAMLIETSKAYGRGLLRGLGQYARLRRGWTIYVQERGLNDPIPEWLSGGDFDGIFLRTSEQATVDEVLNLQIKTVFLGEEVPAGHPAVLNDDAAYASMAVQHFRQRGFRNFAFVGISGECWSDIRRDAFKSEVERIGATAHIIEPTSATNPSSWSDVQRKLTQWLQGLPTPIGILCCYDGIARNVLDACRDSNLLVPEQVAVIGVDNDQVLCEVCDPPLTSISPNTAQLAAVAGSLLSRLIDGEQLSETVIVPPQGIVARASTDIVAVEDPCVARALGMIRRVACDGIAVVDVLGELPISRRTLERRFQALLGTTLQEEISRVRLQRVKELLVQSDLSLQEITNLSGYNYASYMISQFRKSEGLTPQQFRIKRRVEHQET